MSDPTPAPAPTRVIKKFIVRIYADSNTRWLLNDEGLRVSMERVLKSTVYSAVAGTVPQIAVTFD